MKELLMLSVPLVSMGIGGAVEVWDEIFGNKPQASCDQMGYPTAKVKFSLLRPAKVLTMSEPLGLRAEYPAYRTPTTVPNDATIAPLVVVGHFSVLGPLIDVAAPKADLLPVIPPPVREPMLIPAWLERHPGESRSHA